jgi:transposase
MIVSLSKSCKMIVKQVAGIDVSQNELVVCLGRMSDNWVPELYAHKSFSNTPTGFKDFTKWVAKTATKDLPVRYVMEATGVYHQKLAHFLDDSGLEVTIVLPNKISNYARSLDTKTVTDKTASQAIAQFGLERKLDTWKRPKDIYSTLRYLTRERDQLVSERTVLKNQLHAEKSQAHPHKKSLERINKRIALLDKQEKEILAELREWIASDPEVRKLIVILCSIPGIGILTAAIVLAETNGFELIKSKRQLVSYAGLDVREKQSGTSVKGKPKISKKGNKHLRKAMYLPALAAIRHQETFKNIFSRLVTRHGIKMKAAVAIQRKLLELTYTLYRKQEKFNKEIFNQPEGKNEILLQELGGEHM